MNELTTLYTTIENTGSIPEILTDPRYRAYLTPEDALHRGGLWRNGTANRLLRIEPLAETTPKKDFITCKEGFQVLGLASVDAPLFSLSRVFSHLTDEMYVEQTAWRRAFMRPQNDTGAVVDLLNKTLEFRGLTHWKIDRIDTVEELKSRRDPEGMYSWGILFAQSAFEAWRDAAEEKKSLDTSLRVGWSAWFSSHYWDDIEYAANPEPNDSIDWITWDAWAALTLFFAAAENLVTFPGNLLTQHYRNAYRYGLKMAAPIGSGILGYCV